jgi:heme exporter protein C
MREKIMYALGAIGAALLVRNLYQMMLGLPDEMLQGAIYRIMFFHIPGGIGFMIAAFVSMVASVIYLARKSFAADSVAVSVTEIALLLGAINLATGMVWARIIWGVWWAWDARLTFMLISMLMYGGYMMLRQVIEEPVHRARISAVLSILTFPAVVITYKAIDWWRTQHPSPVLSIRTGGGRMDPAMESVLYLNLLAMLLFAAVLMLIRMRQEEMRRELDGLRREAHAI